ncbi:HigA family addiction module antitoxin [Novosphingobium sp. JCM 18896]|uniref:HigA family addiction module antitoxin n=1 Tax=Novosphingobium sp. JCM 18896 TaxID=2989731 RepID=UPI0022218436|nr:HigA family addiction module antitoxin [Novosphingobium sp. JCM 18896]MCW1428987.1 HigA family addiction module antitoxin [Novosphingobium sp. JCM 18896]
MAIQLHPSIYVHPGLWLKSEIVEPHGQNVRQLAQHFGVSRQALSTLLNGRAALSAEMAIRFEKAFGIKADSLMRMQSAYELAQVRAHQDEIAVERIVAAA